MTEQRLLAFAKAWSHKNIDEIIAFFTDDCIYAPSISTYNKNVFKGKDEVRDAVVSLIEFDSSVSSSVKTVYVNNGFGFWEWEYVTESREIIQGCDVFEFDGNYIKKKNAFRKVSI